MGSHIRGFGQPLWVHVGAKHRNERSMDREGISAQKMMKKYGKNRGHLPLLEYGFSKQKYAAFFKKISENEVHSMADYKD